METGSNQHIMRAQKQTEETLRSIMDSALDAIICINAEGKITVWTPQAEKIFGWSEQEMLGKLLTESIIPHQYREAHTQGFNRFLKTGQAKVLNKILEIEALNKAGIVFPVELTITPIHQGDEVYFCAFIRDITVRKKAEEEIKLSELRYRALIEQASDAIMITDNKGKFLEVNSSFCKKFGYEKEELIGAQVSMVIDPEQLRQEPIRFDLLMAGQNIIRERKMVHRDGHIIEVEANVKMIPDGRILAIARDITERKKANAIIEASEKKLRQVLASMKDNFYVIDLEYNVILINEMAEKNLEKSWGVPVKVGTNILPIIKNKKDEAIQESFERVFKGERIEYELRHEQKDLPTWVLVSFMPVNDESGKITGAYVIAQDITERKETAALVLKERDLSDSIINSLPGIFYLFDESGKYIRWNRNFVTISGYSDEEMSNHRPMDYIRPSDRDHISETIEKVFREGYASTEAVLVTKSGEEMDYYVTGILVNYENKQCLLGTGIDISALKKAEKAMKESEERYRASYKEVRLLTEHLQQIRELERTNIAREIHDELGQQLTVLKMDASWLNKKLSNADENIKEKLNDLLQLLDGTVKSVRRISAELRPSLLDDLGLVAAIEWHLQEFEKRSGMVIDLQVDNTDLSIPNDFKTGLYRIFQESLTNVARHSNAHKVIVNLRKENEQIILSIQDDGAGFDRVKVSGKKTLGILGMEERTAMMGGEYHIDSTIGKGTIVTVSVPSGVNSTQSSTL